MNRRHSRSRVLWAAASITAALALTGCHSLPGRPDDDPVPRPSQVLDFNTLYKENCSGCHGAEGKGGAAVSLGDPVYQALVDDATLKQVITNGRAGTLMPAFARSAGGTLTDQQVDVLVHGMRIRWVNPSAGNPPPYTPSGPGDAARGGSVYQTACSGCHGPDGRGTKDGAGSIVDGSFLGLVTDQELRTMIIVGVPSAGMPDWRRHAPGPLSSQDVSDLVAWLGARRPQFPGQPYASQGPEENPTAQKK